MSKVNWTEQQSEAINIRNCDTLVSAAAGSGKTAVLVERVIRMITDENNPADIDKILVVTFTNAAAAQMKEKISAAIAAQIEAHPENAHLRRQLILLGGADIRTYDSFCQNIIKENFQKTDLPFDFELIQKTEDKILRTEALDETFNYFYEDEEKAAAFVNFADSFSGRDDTSAEEFIYRFYDFLRTMPYYTDWLKNCAAEADFESPDDTVWGKYLKDYSLKMLGIAKSAAERTLEFIKSEGEAFGISKYFTTLSDDMGLIEDFISSAKNGYFSAADFAQNKLGFSRMAIVKDCDGDAKEFIKCLRNYIKSILNDLKENIYYLTKHDVDVMKSGTAEIIGILADVIEDFDKRYSLKKLSASLVDFGDISHKCVELLSDFKDGVYVPSDVALKLREKYCEVLIDEYQDTNNLQEHILNMISGSGKRFMVGDIKQSIYKFRNSKPELFLKKYNNYSKDAGKTDRCLLLSKNFRSFENILGFVNFTFEKLMCRDCGGLDYTEAEKLNFSGIYPESENPVEIVLFDKLKDTGDRTADEVTKLGLESEYCANKIRTMVDEGFQVFDGDSMRPCRYSDFTILLRKRKNMSVFKTQLDSYHIPSYIEMSDDYMEQPLIKLILSLFKIIDNPQQDIELAAVLRSELFGFTDDELVDIRLTDKDADFYTCLTKYKSKKAERFFEKLDRWRRLSKILSVYELINTVFDEMMMYTVYAEDSKILRSFSDWGKRYAQSSFKGLFRFITYLQKQLEEKEDMGTANVNTGDSVTVMTIHKSKGLENNIIILAETAGEFRLSESKSRFVYDDELGIAADYVDTVNAIKYKSLPKIAIEQKNKDDYIAEEMRLLYVALTRAKQHLIITASYQKGGLAAKIDKCLVRSAALNESGYTAGAALGANSYLDWILSSLGFHAATVFEDSCIDKFLQKSGTDCNIKVTVNDYPDYASHYFEVRFPDVKEDYGFIPDVNKILGYKYPYAAAAEVPSKLSVSEIKSKFYSETEDGGVVYYPRQIDNSVNLVPTPQFMKEGGSITAAMLGTAYHSILQYLDFGGELGDLECMLDYFVEKSVLTETERNAVDINVIKRFLNSDIFREIKTADKVYKEYSFIMPFDSSAFYPDTHEEIMVQGIIDCLYIKDGEIYIIDYKSDTYGSAGEIADRYRTQLLMYGAAVEKKFGKKPISSVLYMLRTGEIISL